MVTAQLLRVALDGTFSAIAIAVVCSVSPAVGVTTIIGAALIVVPWLIAARRLGEHQADVLSGDTAAQASLLEMVTLITTIKATGAQQVVRKRWRARVDDRVNASIRLSRLDGLLDELVAGVRLALPIAVLGVAWATLGSGDPGRVIGVGALAAAALAPVSTVAGSLRSIRTAGVHLGRLDDFLCEEREPDWGDFDPPSHPVISVEGVGFRHHAHGRDVLADVSMTIRSGEKVSVVGASGSGKTTLAMIVAGVLEPTSGRVLLDDLDRIHHDRSGWQACVGVVLQDSALVAATVFDNISFGGAERHAGRCPRGGTAGCDRRDRDGDADGVLDDVE